MFYKQLMAESDPGKRSRMVKSYFKSWDESDEIIQSFSLWRQYLQRNENYREVCDWVAKTRIKNPIPAEHDVPSDGEAYISEFLSFALRYDYTCSDSVHKGAIFLFGMAQEPAPTEQSLFDIISFVRPPFFNWAHDKGYPYTPELLLTYFIFGDLYTDPVESFRLRVLHLIKCRQNSNVIELSNMVDVLFRTIENQMEHFGIPPTIECFRDELKRILETRSYFIPFIINPFENKDAIIQRIGEMMLERRAILSNGRIEKDELSAPTVFVYPDKKVKTDELHRYLKVFDLQREGKKYREIAEVIYPFLLCNDDGTLRRLKRDKKKATNIIANVEEGIFPGKY